MRHLASPGTRIGGRTPALGERGFRLLLRGAKLLDLEAKLLDILLGGRGIAPGLLRRRIGLRPTRMDEPGFDASDPVGELAISFRRSRLPP